MAGLYKSLIDGDVKGPLKTHILPVHISRVGIFPFEPEGETPFDRWDLETGNFQHPIRPHDCPDTHHLITAAANLRRSNTPVAFPTETVYGLGADATRSSAVKGIYNAKQRPLDNPLIVHVCSLQQLRGLLRPASCGSISPLGTFPSSIEAAGAIEDGQADPIPEIYEPLIKRFWPGPLTIILPSPPNSLLAPEVTAGLSTFGARMPQSLLALALIKMAGVPLAAPSANASTRPSPTTARHVMDDLEGRIMLILDGGACEVGVESTVVDGLSSPPMILRPGGVSIHQLRQCAGWEDVVIGYRDASEFGSTPKAPGMKYKHYSPRARVVLFETGAHRPAANDLVKWVGPQKKLGLITTVGWASSRDVDSTHSRDNHVLETADSACLPSSTPIPSTTASPAPTQRIIRIEPEGADQLSIWEVALGAETEDIARGLFSALRDLDEKEVDAILVEGIRDEGDVAAAVMNRLRKAASVTIEKE